MSNAERAMQSNHTQTHSQATQTEAGDPGVDPRLLEVLVCPVTRPAPTYDREANELVSRAPGLAFPNRTCLPGTPLALLHLVPLP